MWWISRDYRYVFSSNLNENNYDSIKNLVKEGVKVRNVSIVFFFVIKEIIEYFVDYWWFVIGLKYMIWNGFY